MELDRTLIKTELLLKGYSKLSQFYLEDELASVSTATAEMINKWYERNIEDSDYWNYTWEGHGRVLYRIHNLERNKHPSINELCSGQKLLKAVSEIYGDEVVPTAHALIIKLPRIGASVPWHRDPVNVPAGCVYNFSIFLDDSYPANGCLEMLPGSHWLPPEFPVDRDRSPEGCEAVVSKRGDISIHDVRIVHGSGPSTGDSMRRSIVIEFCPKWIVDARSRGLISQS